MAGNASFPGLLETISGGRSVPRLAKFGAATVAFGLVFDASEHSFGQPTVAATAFTAGEHAAHLVVLIGMVLILLGVVADGVHLSRRRRRPEGSPSNANR